MHCGYHNSLHVHAQLYAIKIPIDTTVLLSCIKIICNILLYVVVVYRSIYTQHVCAIFEACPCVHVGEWISGAVCQGLVEFLVNPPAQRRALVSVEELNRVRVPTGSSSSIAPCVCSWRML